MAQSHVILQSNGPVWSLCIDRPPVRNAMGLETFAELDQALDRVSASAECRALLLTTTGDHFIAGGDLQQFQSLRTESAVRAMSDGAKAVLGRLERLPQPVIAAIEGDAIGGGTEVALACDMRVLSETARLRFWQVRNAVTTGWGGGYRLVQLVGQARALELLLTGATLSATEALHLGLANRVVPAGEALQAATALADVICRQPPLAVKALTRLVRSLPTLTQDEANRLETDLFTETWLTEEHQAVVQSFLASRRSTK